MDFRRAGAADEAAMRALWVGFTEEATYTPYPGSPFSPSSACTSDPSTAAGDTPWG